MEQCVECSDNGQCESLNLEINCCTVGNHSYSERLCFECGQVFCYDCCRDTNVDQGGKYDPDYMMCPACGHDIYEQQH